MPRIEDYEPPPGSGGVVIEDYVPGKTVKPERGFIGDMGTAAGDAITGVLDAPSNILKWAGRQVGVDLGQSDYIRRQAASIGQANEPGKTPNNFASDMGEMLGSSAIAGGALLKAGNVVSKAAGTLASPGGSLAGNIARSVAETAARYPKTFAALELGTAATGAAGGKVAESEFPNNPGAKALGQMTGSLGLPAALGATRGVVSVVDDLTRRLPATAWARRQVEDLLPANARGVASDRLRGAADPDRSAAGLKDEILPGTPITPAQRTGQPGVLALEKSIAAESPQLSDKYRTQLEELNTFLKQSVRETGDPSGATVDDARGSLSNLLTQRMEIARLKAQQKIDALGPNASTEEASRLLRTEMDNAYNAAKAQKDQLWKAVPESTPALSSKLHETYSELNAELSQASKLSGDMPPIATRLLSGDKPLIGPETTIKELEGFRSKMLELARNARAGEAPNANLARIASRLADAALEDMGAMTGKIQGEAGTALRKALDFTREVADKFQRGPVGKLMERSDSGADVVAPGLTAERTIGKAGAAAREEADALTRAAEFSGNAPAARGHMETWLKNEFNAKVTNKDGEVDFGKVQTYLRNRAELLTRFPELRKQMEDAANSGKQLARVAAGDGPAVSAANVFLRAEPEDAIKKTLSSGDPRQNMRALVLLAKKDSSGLASRGLKDAFTDYLMKASLGSDRTASGERFLSGGMMKDMLTSPRVRAAMEAAFTPDEIHRLKVIAETARKMDLARTTAAAKEGIVDGPNFLAKTVAGIVGARAGRALDTGTIQAPGKAASLFQKWADSLLGGPPKRLLMDAVHNEELFKTLLMNTKNPAKARLVEARLNGWAAGVLREQAENQ